VLRPVIEKKNIFRQLNEIGKTSTLANAYPHQFFDYVKDGTRRLSVTTLSCSYAGIPLRTADDLRKNQGVAADIIRAHWKDDGYPDIPVIAAYEAGTHLTALASKYDFTVFEYWITDHAGHSQKMDAAVEAIEMFDEFLLGILESFDASCTTILITSDHDNIEDLSTKSHTRNRVPCVMAGKHRHLLAEKIRDLTHITPALMDVFLLE
jgi:hypothetical protein